ncbi:MAG: hypothetical protein ACK4OH_19815 [Acidovorax temperans]|uniref:hypothetical protein n=1 Tax=Acidovorax temperans TaxID=80878 RepID=UPI00391CE9C5
MRAARQTVGKVRTGLRRNRRPIGSDAQSPHWLDVWLPRLSHLAQFGLFLFTVGSLYFTVLPLYQKALLDEAIARKELELKAATASLNEKYARIRAFAVKEYVMFTGAECTGLLRRPTELPALGEKAKPIPPRAENVYAIDIRKCLLDSMDRVSSLKELDAQDMAHFRGTLLQVGERLSKARDISLVEYRRVPERITEKEIAALPASSARVQMLEFVARIYPADEMRVRRRALAEDIEKERIGKAYEDLITREVYGLRSLSWPSSTERHDAL